MATMTKESHPTLVIGNVSAKTWFAVTQREKNGEVVDRQQSEPMGLVEAISEANRIRADYRRMGLPYEEERFFDQATGESVFVFVT